MSYYFPPILIVLGLVVYQVSQRSVDKDSSPFVVIGIAYFIGMLACIAGYFIFPKTESDSLLTMIKTISWSALGIGFGAAAIEFGFLLAYRVGWNVSTLPISTNVLSALILILVGLYIYREHLSMERLCGILLCIGGLILINYNR
jgi:drug/metabolite transporter (DMT)-like permease